MYDPSTIDRSGGGRFVPQPGAHEFTITKATVLTFKTGSRGCKVQFDVFAGGRYPSKAWENFSFKPQALWKLEQLCHSIGIPFDPAPQAHELVGLSGVAEWNTEPNGEYTDLIVKEFLVKPDAVLPPPSEPDPWLQQSSPAQAPPHDPPPWDQPGGYGDGAAQRYVDQARVAGRRDAAPAAAQQGRAPGQVFDDDGDVPF